ncbi:MAG: hypothetical protein Ct9H300mP8_00470 [Gammaproteobacteria bacterium]|nr:MAG: hypothetical protein Ct9H300mP8_00470 [Gammaproteobacteria bacterium]
MTLSEGFGRLGLLVVAIKDVSVKPIWVFDGAALSDHSSHGTPDDVSAGLSEMVEQVDYVSAMFPSV